MAEMWTKTKSFTLKCKRVWHTLKKPSRKEFETVAKISAVGILLLGAIGFAISVLMKIFF
ncbi:protein translocase SEC61 complex subunit gamma [Candidatus Pacearchaeota archaeon]|nr:protein translocase SEC61 complex subunit gamma [Candidatus Pacearchaeota archaeon]